MSLFSVLFDIPCGICSLEQGPYSGVGEVYSYGNGCGGGGV